MRGDRRRNGSAPCIALPALALLVSAAGCQGSVGPISRVVVVTFDTTRADRIGCYGYEGARTPHLDRLAAEGVLFEQAVSPVPTTLPAHASIFTGLYPHDHGIRYNHLFRLPPEATTLAELFGAAGYATAAFPGSRVLDSRFGLDQGFGSYVDVPPPEDRSVDPTAALRPAAEGVDLALAWLDGHAEDDALLWLHFYEPHWRYEPPFPFSAEFRERPYDGEIAYADQQLGRLLERLRADSRWPETLVIVAADHGEGLYDHRERFHAYLVYESTQRVPLIIRAPGIRAARIAEPVGLTDILPTVLDLVGLEAPRGLRGISLRPALEGGPPPTRELYFETLAGSIGFGWRELKGVRYGNWKLIDSDSPELFDLDADPGELRNLATSEPERLAEMRVELERVSRPSGDALEVVAPEGTEAEIRASLAGLGYIGGSASGRPAREGAAHPREMIDLEGEIMNGYLAVRGEAWSRVEEVSRHVMSRDPRNRWALESLVEALIRLDRAGEAVPHAEALIGAYPDGETGYTLLARVQQETGDPAAARETLGRGLEQRPDSEELTYLVLLADLESGLPAVCDRELAGAIGRHQRSWKLMLLGARCHIRHDRPEEALKVLKEAMRLGFARPEMLLGLEEFDELVRLPGYRELVPASVREGEGG